MDQGQISDLIAAAAALGTAAFALVDVTKTFRGGVSNCGFRFIAGSIKRLFPHIEQASGADQLFGVGALLGTLHANWLNGMASADQKAVAKSLVKLRISADTAASLARATGLPEDRFAPIAAKIAAGQSLVAEDLDVYGRFDLMLSAILDQGYQRAEQVYRNSARSWALAFAVVLAFAGGWIVHGDLPGYLGTALMWKSLLLGTIATPLAPIAKDLTSALAAGVRVAQMVRK